MRVGDVIASRRCGNPDDRASKAKALQEIARVLKTNGRLVICYAMSHEAINQVHQSIGGVVANDLLPNESQLRDLIEQAALIITHLEDGPEWYLGIAERQTNVSSTASKEL